MSERPFVTVLIACRNEGRHIRPCLKSIDENDYPKDRLEVIVLDGMSEDDTRKIVQEYALAHPYVKLIENPKKITTTALNIGIKASKGEYIVWMGAHSSYAKDYISKCIEASLKYGVENVGGAIVAVKRDESFMADCITKAISHPFGIGGAKFRIPPKEPTFVDTVFGGCYRRDVFDRIGLFNEDLERSQDIEFNLRLRKAGGRIMLVPDIISYYSARTDFWSFLKHNYSNGVWAIVPFKYSTIIPVGLRHLVPLGFVSTLLGSAILSLFVPAFKWIFLITAASYMIANLIASISISFKNKDVRYFLVMPFIFASLHIGYGVGSLAGLSKVSTSLRFWKNLIRIFRGV